MQTKYRVNVRDEKGRVIHYWILNNRAHAERVASSYKDNYLTSESPYTVEVVTVFI